jgi:ABC-type uncharacterized transport system auxiliary subunit
MRKAALTVLLAAGLWACFSASPNKVYLQLHLEASPALPGPAFDKALYIERVAVDELYDDFRIIYRLTPFEINYYSYSFWAEKPARMVRDALDHYLTGRKAFRSLLPDASRSEADWILRTSIHRIEEVDAAAAWAARLSMALEMVEAKTGAVLASRRFDRSEPIGRKDLAAVPPILSRILAEELEALLADLKGK